MSFYTLPASQIEDLASTYSAQRIASDGHLAGIRKFRGITVTCTGGVGTGTGTGYTAIFLHQVIPRHKYKGRLQPLRYSDHWTAVVKGGRTRSYTGMLVRYKHHDWVFVGPSLEARPSQVGENLFLFT